MCVVFPPHGSCPFLTAQQSLVLWELDLVDLAPLGVFADRCLLGRFLRFIGGNGSCFRSLRRFEAFAEMHELFQRVQQGVKTLANHLALPGRRQTIVDDVLDFVLVQGLVEIERWEKR